MQITVISADGWVRAGPHYEIVYGAEALRPGARTVTVKVVDVAAVELRSGNPDVLIVHDLSGVDILWSAQVLA